MSTPQMIMLDPGYTYEEGVLDTVASPGMNIKRASDGKFDPGAPAVEGSVSRIVMEDSLQGKTIDDAYAVGDVVRYGIPKKGERVLLKVLDGETVVIGSLMVANSAGKFIVETSETVAQFEADEAVSPSGSDGFVRARAL